MENKTDKSQSTDTIDDTETNIVVDKTLSKSERRRKLIKSFGASGGIALTGLAASPWVKPTVNAVILPSHAEMSAIRGVVQIGEIDVSTFDSVVDVLVNKAYGDPDPVCVLPKSFCFDISAMNGILMVTIFDQTKVPDGGTVTYTDGVEFTVTVSGIAFNSETIQFVIKATITGNLITGTISCTGTNKSPSGEEKFNGTIQQGGCATLGF